ncbi:hypothetical protein JCM3765_000159 [Sporobolomyces pararoseus]
MSSSRSTPIPSVSRPRARVKSSSPSKIKTSSVNKRTRRAAEPWSTDEEDTEAEEEIARKPRQVKLKKRKSQASSIVRNFAFSLLRSFIYPVLPYLLLSGVLYILIAYSRSLLYSYLSLLPSFLQPSLTKFANISLPLPHLSQLSLSTLTCATVGINCPSNNNVVRGAARRAAFKGQQALSVFDHLLALGNEDTSAGLALHPVEIWELSTAIRYSSGIADKDFISTELASLGDSVREVKDSVIDLNAQGMNAFIWIVHEFTRLQDAISRAASAPKRSKKQDADLERLLDSLFDKISVSLGELLVSLDKAIPIATAASDKSRRIGGVLRAEEYQAVRQINDKGWVEWMKEVKGAKGKQLRRDMELAQGSADAILDVTEAMEATRNSLRSYSKNVGYFKAGVVGYHLSNHELSVEDEVSSLESVMDEMKATLEGAKSRTRKGNAALVREIGSG